jgi:hypothetical protein
VPSSSSSTTQYVETLPCPAASPGLRHQKRTPINGRASSPPAPTSEGNSTSIPREGKRESIQQFTTVSVSALLLHLRLCSSRTHRSI